MKVLVDGVCVKNDLLLKGRSEYQGPEVYGLVYINEGTTRPGTFHTVDISKAYEYDLIRRIVCFSVLCIIKIYITLYVK